MVFDLGSVVGCWCAIEANISSCSVDSLLNQKISSEVALIESNIIYNRSQKNLSPVKKNLSHVQKNLSHDQKNTSFMSGDRQPGQKPDTRGLVNIRDWTEEGIVAPILLWFFDILPLRESDANWANWRDNLQWLKVGFVLFWIFGFPLPALNISTGGCSHIIHLLSCEIESHHNS